MRPWATNTAFIERLNGTFRERWGTLVRRGRVLARQTPIWHWGMYLVGTVYSFCTDHRSLHLPGLVDGRQLFSRTPARAGGITDHRWTVDELM